jgi:predicted dehydrogenase
MVLDAFRRQTEDFARAVQGADTNLATAREAARALRAAELATAAIRDGTDARTVESEEVRR